MAKNPFEFFGLSPDLAAELSEKELFSVLKAMYRALLKTVHPDLAGASPAKNRKSMEKAVELNLAFEALNLDKDPASFRKYRKSFVAKRPKSAYQKSLALERELVLAQAHYEILAEAYLERLAFASGWQAPELPADSVPLSAGGVKLGLVDVAINQNLKMASWSLGSNYKQMELDAEGRVFVKPVGRRRFSEAKYIHLIGSIPLDAIELPPLLERPPAEFFKAPALNASIGANGPSISVLNRISAAKFKTHVLALLRPIIMERAYLFSLNRAEFAETGCISLEGLTVKLERADSSKNSTQSLMGTKK